MSTPNVLDISFSLKSVQPTCCVKLSMMLKIMISDFLHWSQTFLFNIFFLYNISIVSVNRRGRKRLANELLLFSSLFHHMERYTTRSRHNVFFNSLQILVLYPVVFSATYLSFLFKAPLIIFCKIYQILVMLVWLE